MSDWVGDMRWAILEGILGSGGGLLPLWGDI